MLKIVFFASVAVLSFVNGNILTSNGDLNNEIAPIDREGRILLEVPIIGTIILKTLKAIWFFLSNISSIFDLKLASMAVVSDGRLCLLSVAIATWAPLLAFHQTKRSQYPEPIKKIYKQSAFLISKGAVSLAVTAISWAYNNCFSLVLGAGAVIGFCKLTGLCTLNNKLDIVSDTLSYAVNNLDLGTLKYGTK